MNMYIVINTLNSRIEVTVYLARVTETTTTTTTTTLKYCTILKIYMPIGILCSVFTYAWSLQIKQMINVIVQLKHMNKQVCHS